MAFRSFDDATLSRRSLLRGTAYMAAGAGLAGLPLGQLAMAHDVSDSFPNIAAMVNRYLSQNKVASLLVTLGTGQEDHAHTVGGGSLSFGSSTRVTEDSLFRIYSMTKPITGIATMMLVDEGKLGLDQPLAETLPAFANMRVLVDPKGSLDNTVAAERPITIRHLLTHTAGLGYIIHAKSPITEAFAENGLVGGRVSRFPIPGLPEVTPAPNLEVWADRLATLPLIAQPGTEWHYSASIDLLGRVIEVASGQSFESFLQDRIFEPCGMESTYFTVPGSETDRLTTNYGIAAGIPLPVDGGASSIFTDEPSIPAGGGGLVSSPKDYDRFMRMLLGYGRLGSKRVMGELAVRVGTSNLVPDAVHTAGTWIAGQGHGAGGRVLGEQFGWGGAAGTLSTVDFGSNMRIGLFTQYMPPETLPMRDEFIAAIQADIGGIEGL
ncbi:serine hydrolase domain-containing protein [Erythrobacter sp. HA6-11]